MPAMKTPGVYIVEKSAFPNSVVEVATAVPAFVGYTEKADNKGKTLLKKPWKISSMAEFHNYFGYGPKPVFTIGENSDVNVESDFSQDGKNYLIQQKGGNYLLYNSMKLFFSNGGGPCYIVSVGFFADSIDAQKIDAAELIKGIGLLIKEQEPTMLVVPDTNLLPDIDSAISVQQAALAHCGGKMRNRVALLDIFEGYKELTDPDGSPVAAFRDKLGTNYLDFGIAYYPWIKTSIVQDNELSFVNFDADGLALIQTVVAKDLDLDKIAADPKANDNAKAKAAQMQAQVDSLAKTQDADWGEDATNQKRLLQSSLVSNSALFNNIMKEAKNKLNVMPPAAAMAGIFTMVDNSRGVWKAPANVSLNAVVSPTVNISHDDQEDLNVTPQGKSINAIRTFVGEGTMVWGARTLDGNSLDWRYIQVRRTMIMLEESIKLAAKAYVFDNNEANTWITIKSMIRNFLTGIWKRGGLAGTSPDDAFTVLVGLGETMTAEDILEGILRITVLVALIRPAEFIEITFQQQMQKS